MRMLFYLIIASGLFSNPVAGQKITTLGGISCGWNLPPTVTVCEGSTINAKGWVSSYGSYGFSWGTYPFKFTAINSVSSTSNNSSAKITFNKPGIYQISLVISQYGPAAYKTATVIVLPKTRLSHLVD